MLLATCGKKNLDRRVILSLEDKEGIRKEYLNKYITKKALAKKYGVDTKTIKNTVDSEYNKKLKELHREYIRNRQNLYKEKLKEGRRK